LNGSTQIKISGTPGTRAGIQNSNLKIGHEICLNKIFMISGAGATPNQHTSTTLIFFFDICRRSVMDTATTTSASVQPSFAQRLRRSLAREFQRLLDLSAPQIAARYVALGVALGIYALRVYLISGFYIISYALGIFLLNLFIGFLSPQEDPDAAEGFALPNAAGDEFKPFVRRLPEFKFWYSSLKAVCISFLCTFLPFLDVPVFWPILLFYFLMLFGLTMRRQITHVRAFANHRFFNSKL
jgi:hypothetical protein